MNNYIFKNLILIAIFLFGGPLFTQAESIYTFGDYTYNKDEGNLGIKLGFIPADQIPDGFPIQFLEPDESYPGGRIYQTIAEADGGLLQAKDKGELSLECDWGIYRLQGNWEEYAYERHPNEFFLRKSTFIISRIK